MHERGGVPQLDKYPDFTPWREKWDFGNARTKKVKNLWHLTKEKILNLAIVSVCVWGGAPLNGASIWPQSFNWKVEDNEMMKINVKG